MTWQLGRRLALAATVAALVAILLWSRGMGGQVASTISALGRLGPGTIGAAFALSTLGALLSGVEWWRILARLGYRVRFRVALSAYVSAGLGGYLVNAVGPALGCVASLRRHGVSAGRATLLTLIANALGLCGVLVWVPVGLLLLSRTGMDRVLPIVGTQGPAAAALVLGAMAVMMILVLGALASAAGSRNRLARRVLGRVPSAEDERPIALHGGHLLALVPWSAGSWVAGALSLYVVLAAMSPGHAFGVVAVVGSAVIAATLGSLAFFVPEGMGVSDAALVALLVHATGLPATTCIAAAVAARAVDPLTKVSLLIVLLLAGNQIAARLLGAASARLVRMLRGITLRRAVPAGKRADHTAIGPEPAPDTVRSPHLRAA